MDYGPQQPMENNESLYICIYVYTYTYTYIYIYIHIYIYTIDSNMTRDKGSTVTEGNVGVKGLAALSKNILTLCPKPQAPNP